MKDYGRIIKSLVVVYLVIMLMPSGALATDLTPPTVEDELKNMLDAPVDQEELINSLEEMTDGEFTELDPLTNHIFECCPDLTQGEQMAINSMFSKQLNTPDGTDKFQFYINYLDNSSEPIIYGMTADELYKQSPYYQSVYESFEQIIKTYGHMSSDAKLEFLLTETPGMENTIRIFDEANDDKKAYIMENTSSNVEEINALSEELSSKSPTDLMGDLKWVEKQSEEIEKAEADYHKAVSKADKKYDIDNPSTLEKIGSGIAQCTGKLVGSSYDPKAYVNAMTVYNELSKVNRNPRIENGFDNNNNNRSQLEKGDLVQHRIVSSNPNQPMYKYYLIKNESVKDGEAFWAVDELVLDAKDAKGESVKDPKKEVIADVAITGDLRKNIAKSELTPENTPYTIHLDNTTRDSYTRDLYTAYSTDPTGLNKRLDNVPSAANSRDLVIGITNILAGVSQVGFGIGLLIFGGWMWLSIITAAAAVPIIVAGALALALGIINITTGIVLWADYDDAQSNHITAKKDIFNDIKKHNNNPVPTT